MWWWHDGPDGWGIVLMALMMGFIWIPLTVLLLWGLRGSLGLGAKRETPTPPPPDDAPDAREIARRAYARGELDRERFLQIIEDLDRTDG